MPFLFQRRCDLILVPPIPGSLARPPISAGILVRELRTQFKVEKSITKEPNVAEIQVFNLAEKTRKQLQAKGTLVILMAGYEGTKAQIFSGDSRTIDHVRDGADWITKIQCGDGERAYRYAIVNESFKPGQLVAKAARRAVQAMLVDPGNSEDKLSKIFSQYVSGYAMQGKASAELDSILAGQGLEWSIQDGKMQILAPDEPTANSAVLLDAQSGLIGSPEHGSPEMLNRPGILKIKTLLNPQIQPGRRVKVSSLDIPGAFFRVEKLTHTGDTQGGEWYSSVEGRAL